MSREPIIRGKLEATYDFCAPQEPCEPYCGLTSMAIGRAHRADQQMLLFNSKISFQIASQTVGRASASSLMLNLAGLL
jgi:hypothetical protein